ncbi:MAG: M60 family metallopeptidase [Alloprevotella sp.]
MKNFYLVWRHCLLMVLGCFICLGGFAQLSSLEQGKVYRFVNRMYPGYSMSVGSMTKAIGAATVESSKSQLWYVAEVSNDGSSVPRYRLRSYGNGRYLQGAGASTQWNLVENSTTDNTYLYLLTVGDTYNTMSLENSANNKNKMHCDASKNIVGWSVDGEATQWTISEVELSEAEIEANWEAINNFVFTDEKIADFKTALAAIFTDDACTTLNSTYAAMTSSALQADDNYNALPVTLQNMVLKVWNEQTSTQDLATAWAEDHVSGESAKAWSGDYAKRYRVQNYELYTNRDCVNSALKINIHTNLNNPTGIITKERDALYIMVEGEIKDGASLYLGSYSGHGQAGNATDGVQLQTGLNVIPCFVDKQWTCIYYTANTLKEWDGTTNKGTHPLSYYPDLKIHIEGGNVNGYYNEVGDALYAHGRTGENVTSTGDNELDWDYLAARNVLDDITIVGKRIVFQFQFNPVQAEDGKTYNGTDYYFTEYSETTTEDDVSTTTKKRRVRIPDFLERWNRVVWAQNMTMGLVSEAEVNEANAKFPTLDDPSRGVYAYTGNDSDNPSSYEDYYRMHCLAIGIATGYMSGGWTSSNYNYSTYESIIQNIIDQAGPVWGPAHEIGHQHQGPINMNGLTEVTNNLFANVCAWYGGLATSRTNRGEGDLTEVLKAYNEENNDFFTNNIWAQTQMYYKLWLYYHLAGHNNKFYPRLFEMLRRDPLQITYNQFDDQSSGTLVTGKTPLLHFYKKCCEAAGEDLTEFFRAYGFFTPMDKRYVGDYSSSEYTQTQAQIDATIAEVKALGYPENHTVLFINDCTTGATFYQHDGVTQRAWWDNNTYSDLGAYTDYNGTTSNDEVSGTYELTVANGTATMSGATGGAGFLIYDEKGNLLAFSSDYSFPLSDEALLAIANGIATVKVLNAEGAATEVVYDGGSAAISLLSGLLDEVKIVVDAVDDGGTSGTDYTKVGFYKKAEVSTLLNLYNEAKALYDENAQSGYVSAYTALKAEYDAVMANEYARVAFLPGSTCVLVNKSAPTRYLSETESNTVTTTNVSGGVVVADVPEAGQWVVEASSTTAGAYTFKTSTGDYWLALSQSVQLQTGETAKDYTFIDNHNGSWGIKYSENNQLIHKEQGNTIVGWWDTTNQNSHWYITMVSKPEAVEAAANLETLVAQTTTLMNKMANVSGKGAQDMSTFRISSNATEQGHGTELMVDGDLTTFFHTVWSGTSVDENHYFQIDCGEGLSLGDFVLSYTTRPAGSGGNDAPTNIIITGSNTTDADGNVTDWQDITTLSEGLPTGKAASYTSPTIGSSSNPYRYLRFTVTTASGGTFGGYYYFGIAELGISRPEAKVNSIVEKYADSSLGDNQLTDTKLIAADDALYDSKQLLATASPTTSDLTTQYTTLKAQYDILLATYNAAESADLTAAKAALQTVIDETQTLLDGCGSVSIVKANVSLQSTDANASGYLYCNAPYTASNNDDYSVQGTDGYHLLDGDKSTYLHTNYNKDAGPGEDHYLRVYVGDGGIGQFRMLYTTRNDGNGQPTKMVIEGSDEADGTYTEIATLTKDDATNPLPITTSTDYTSDYFEGGTYQYLRFRVLGNTATNGNPDGHYWFCMAEFRLEKKPSTTITNNNVGAVMDDDILTTYNAIESAQTAYDMATTVAQLTAAKAELQAQYEVLFAASTANVEGREDLKTAIDNATTLKNSCYETDAQGNTVVKTDYLSNPNFSLEDLQALESAITTATTVYRTASATTDEVTAQVTALNDAMAQLNRSFDYMALPITLTTNETAPVKYTMYVNRGDNILAQYRGTVWPGDDADANNYKIHLAPNGVDNGNPYQAFYFTRGTSGTQLLMKAAADGRTFAVETGNLMTNGANKVAAYDMATTTATFAAKEWTMVANESHSGWFNIKAVPTDAEDTNIYYFSNWGGTVGDQNFGFYSDDVNDDGNLFRFEAWQEADKSALETAIAGLNSVYDSCYDIDGETRTLKAAYDNENFDATVLDGVATLVSDAQTVLNDANQYQLAAEEKAAELNAKVAAIQAQQNIATLPITLTTDTNNPVLYTIHFQRSETPYYLQYRGDESHNDYREESDYNKLKYTATLDKGNPYQAFYFTRGTEGARLYMHAAADNKVFSVITGDLGTGAGKVKAFAADEATQTFDAREWTISANANNEGWFNIAPAPNAATPVYLHNWNGITENPDNIGFDTAADNAGSLFKFEEYLEADKTALNTALTALNTAYAACFSDEECTTIKSDYDGSLNINATTLAEVKAVIDAAQTVYADAAAYQSSIDEQTALVQAQTLALQNLVAYAALPVKLTTDPAAPHYYRIYVNRDGRPLWQARTTDDASSTKVQLTTSYDLGVDRQAWYFTAASEAPKVYIVNKNTSDRVLACTTSDFAEGAGKLQSLAVDAENVGANEWTISNTGSNSGWYNITTVKTTTSTAEDETETTTNTTFYISNHSGVNFNMGFWNSATDPGSNFQFEEIDPDRSAAYIQLYNYFHNEMKVAIDMTAETPAFPADMISDTAIGYYSESLTSDYLSAYVLAYFYLESSGDDSYLTAAYNALVAANEALAANQIDFDAYYVLRNAYTGYCNNAVAYANVNDHKVYWHAQAAKVETTYTVDTNGGTVGSGNYFKTWTSTETPQVTFTNEYNNMQVSNTNLVIYSGETSAPFKLNAPSGYVIDSYSVTFANNGHNNEQTLTFSDEGAVYKTTSASQTYTVENSGKSSVTINLTGSNNGVVLTDFTVKIRPSFTENEAVNVWKFEQAENGNIYLKNVHTGTYLTNAGTQYGGRQLSTTAQPVTFVVLGDEQQNIKLNNGNPLHAQNDGKAVVSYPGGKNSASAWYIEKVAAPEEITTRINMTQYEKASLYLAYPAIIPEGITAYYAKSVADATIEGTSGGSIYLTPVEGSVLPAGTPVILKGAQGAYKFDLSTTDEGTVLASNLFEGSAYKKLVQGEEGYKYYLFGVKTVSDEKKVGLYPTWLEYRADGTTSYTQDTDETDSDGNPITETISTAGTDDGGYFYVSANKIYLPWNTATGGSAPAFYFNFDGNQTGIGQLEGFDKNASVYDLQGRRINRIEQTGVYIINGQKRLVKVNGGR